MKRRLVLFIMTVFIFATHSTVYAQVTAYESTENAGLNKKERIDAVEKYLADLAASLKKMEAKLDENSQKMKSLEDVVKAIKEAEAKKVEPKLGEQKAPNSKEKSEMDKLKADILAIKNQDIEKLKMNFEELSDTVRMMQATMRK